MVFKLSDIELWENKPQETEPGKILPCDPGTQWKDMEITLTSYETVTVKTPKGTGRFHYSQLGFSDKRKGDKPIRLWAALKIFCKNYGQINSKTITNAYYLSKSISDLNKKL